jgi:hypothetical protein
MTTPTYDRIADVLEGLGLRARGGFPAVAADGVPPLAGGRPAVTLVLAGNAGPAMWAAFAADCPDTARDNEAYPSALDSWSRDVLERAAGAFGGPEQCMPLFPFGGPPHLPFQRWAQRAESVHPSPLGPLVHPTYGLWHAYRGALAFAAPIDLPGRDDHRSPCEPCTDRPCLKACPVGAHGHGPFRLGVCIRHVDSEAGAECMSRGCLARRACPVGTTYRYAPDQARFHMTAFRRANRSAAAGS